MTTTDRPQPAPTTSVEHIAQAIVPTAHGDFTAHAYRSLADNEEHLAYTMGPITTAPSPLVRLHSECLTGDVLASDRCDCGRQLHNALCLIAQEQCGVLVYLRGHEGRGIGLGSKIRAYALQDSDGLDTVDANTIQGLPVDSRDYLVGVAILADLKLSTVRVLTNNPEKVEALTAGGFVVAEQISLHVDPTPANSKYLSTKRDRMGHRLL
jgi:3,4-dihydroxy 2-butanone 4-phosphate synthase/GTP cyclohydrolase II